MEEATRRRRRRCITEMVETGSVESQRYFLARRSVMEMLRDRGEYEVPLAELAVSLSDFRSVFGDNPDVQRLHLSFPLLSNPSKKILVVFMGTDEIKKRSIGALSSQILNKENIVGLILVVQSGMNHHARKALDEFPFKVEIFHIADLLVNPTKHVLQPKQEILTAKQKQELLNEYKVQAKQLPKMLKTDAVARYYGLDKGQVVKVTYSGGYVESLATYRCIV